MNRPKRPRSAEEYKPRWDKSDDIFEVVSDMFGPPPNASCAEPVTTELPLTPEVTGASPLPLPVRGWSRPSEHLPALLQYGPYGATAVDESTASDSSQAVLAANRRPITPERSGSGTLGAPNPKTFSKRQAVLSRTTDTDAPAPRKARTVQDGHSLTEQHIYDTLWRDAIAFGDDFREITIGYRTLAEKTRLHRNTIDRNLASLKAKLAIEVTKAEDRAGNIGRTYRVYSFRSILKRREAAGLVWFVKDRSGVLLRAEPRPGPATSHVTGPITAAVTGRITLARPGAITSSVATPLTPEVTNNKEQEEDSLLETSATSAVAIVLRDEIGFVDDGAVRRIILDCRAIVADATAEEIAHFTRITAKRARTMKGLQNPVGLIIVQVPKCFGGVSFQLHRKSEKARKDSERNELLRIAKEIFSDPEMPADSRKWAEEILRAEE